MTKNILDTEDRMAIENAVLSAPKSVWPKPLVVHLTCLSPFLGDTGINNQALIGYDPASSHNSGIAIFMSNDSRVCGHAAMSYFLHVSRLYPDVAYEFRKTSHFIGKSAFCL